MSQAEKTSLGYDHIEKLIETENFTNLNKSFAEAYHKLELMFGDVAGGVKKQKEAEKAMKAYELTTDLLNYLLAVKKQVIQTNKK